jgi:SAM-dependent methyltransferase
MPDVAWNRYFWNETSNWPLGGEEWSATWGGSSAQWFGSLLPRLRCFVPCRAILEIAPGFGRWTRFLLALCQEYAGIDVSETCVAACRERFASQGSFHTNDGYSLAAVPDGRFDLVFSFDSLVHAEMDVIQSYLPQVVSKLRSRGVAFLHHSNLRMLDGKAVNNHARAPTVSAALVQTCVNVAGGHVLRQEIIDWGGTEHLDCLTLFARAGAYDQETIVRSNTSFMAEAEIIRSSIAPWQFDSKPIEGRRAQGRLRRILAQWVSTRPSEADKP